MPEKSVYSLTEKGKQQFEKLMLEISLSLIHIFKQSRAVKAAEQKAAQNMSEQHGLQIRHGAASRSSAISNLSTINRIV